MYISTEAIQKLDEIVKSFEVAYRSKIASSLVSQYPAVGDFSLAINKVALSQANSTTIFSKKFKSKADKIAKEVGSYYKRIEDCYNAYLTKVYDNKVPYLSEILDYVSLFFNQCFQSLANNFATIEEFNLFSSKYLNVRNSLSHPASEPIKTQDARDVVSFILIQLKNIESDKFWYVSSKIIETKCDELLKIFDDSIIKIHNLDEVSFPYNKIVCRDAELELLRTWLLGKEENYRKSGSVVIYGYGGVGKTALILEFIYKLVKDINDRKIITPYDFIFFFTSKEESLQIKQTTGEAYISSMQKQISSFVDFQEKLNKELSDGNILSIAKSKGLIVLDNFETLSDSDRLNFFEFIRQMPRTIQFVITSRNEEICEDKLPLKEFKDIRLGVKFINEYILANEIKLKFLFLDHHKQELVQLSKGNTLIIVLIIQQLSIDSNLNQALTDLRSVEASNMEIIADFMYKNAIQKTIDELSSSGKHPIEILKIISLYGEVIDLYSISSLSSLNISEVESICNTFTSRLVLNKIGESFEANEFANKFILLKYLPNNIEKADLLKRINTYRRQLAEKLKNLEASQKREAGLRVIMSDWKPKHIIDKIAIAESYTLFAEYKTIGNDPNIRYKKVNSILKQFDEIEKKTSHPYIKFQIARFLVEVDKTEPNKIKREEFRIKISKSYEEAIIAATFYHSYIVNTKSFASINWKYGLFCDSVQDSANAAKYMEDAIEIFRRIKKLDKTYYQVMADLSFVYLKLYSKTTESKYKFASKEIYYSLKNNSIAIKSTGFQLNTYIYRYLNNLRRG